MGNPLSLPALPSPLAARPRFPQFGSSRMKEDMFAMSGWRRRELAASPELLHTRRWARSMRSSLHREEFFLQCVESRSRERDFFAGGVEKQSSKRRKPKCITVGHKLHICSYSQLCPLSPGLIILLLYLPCENGFQKPSAGLYSTVEIVLKLLSIHHFIRELKDLKFGAWKYAESFCCLTFVSGKCSISLQRFIFETFLQ